MDRNSPRIFELIDIKKFARINISILILIDW